MLIPGRYVGAAPIEYDGLPFETKMSELSQTLCGQMKEAEKLDAVIRKNLEVSGYGERNYPGIGAVTNGVRLD